MTGRDDVVQDAIELLRRPVARSPGAVDAIVRNALDTRASRLDRIHALRQRLTGRRFVLSPLAAAAWTVAVAVLAAAAVLALGPMDLRDEDDGAVVRHQFVLIAPDARSVALVGDFNGWSVGATPLVRRGEAWIVELPLRPGRHVYSFVIDGSEWVADATAPRVAEDDFGRPSSVVLVGASGP